MGHAELMNELATKWPADDNLSMTPRGPDFDSLFSHRGGFATAYAKLIAFAVTVIHKRSGPTPNGQRIAKMDAIEIVNEAFKRLLLEQDVFENGEEIYLQLRRHIDNRVRTIQKQKSEPELLSIGSGNQEGHQAIFIVEPSDDHLPDPATESEALSEDEFYGEMLKDLKGTYASGGIECNLIDLVLEGWTDRKEMSELLGVPVNVYDAALKRVSRAAQKLKMKFAKRKAK